ncbi:AAA family ATPase [Sorangium sp. So ce1153]|uniref:AAA family ATPase n=1 Tax=Sorangium sp. So ce1153 TaxID=3133333 RepID=UPI003F60A92F
MLRKLKLKGVGPSPSLALELAVRLNVLTGDNGVGKSFLLDIAWWALTRTWASNPALPRDNAKKAVISYVLRGKTREAEAVVSTYRFSEQQWPLKAKRPAMPGIVIYARVDGGFSVWDPARNYWRSAPSLGVDDRDRPPAYHFDNQSVWSGLSVNGKRACEGLIRDWVSWQKGNDPEFHLLAQVLEALSVPEEPLKVGPPQRVRLGEGYDTPTIATSYGTVPITHASAGVRRAVALAYLLVWAWREHRLASELQRRRPDHRLVLLIDEPETHLHPKWQRLFVPAVLQAVKALRESESAETQLITSTHAPLVLASLEPLFDPQQDDLLHLEVQGGRVELRSGMWAKQGDADAWLTSDVFNLEQARSRPAEIAIEAAEAFMRGDREALSEGLRTREQIDEELRRLLPAHDPFWARWLVSRSPRGRRRG